MRLALAAALSTLVAWVGAGLAAGGGSGPALAQDAQRDLAAGPVI